MPKFRPPQDKSAHLSTTGIAFRFDSFPGNPVIEPGRTTPPVCGPVHCRFDDSEGAAIATGYGNNHEEAFNNGYAKIAGQGKPKTKGELIAELNATRAALAAATAPPTPAPGPKPVEPADGDAGDEAETTARRGRGRPPGAKNKPKDDDKGAGNNTQDDPISSTT